VAIANVESLNAILAVMTSMHVKLGVIAVGMVVLILVPYFLWDQRMDAYFQSPAFAGWVASAKPCAWSVAIVLMVGDLVLPIPASPVVATAGAIYGAFWGGVIGAVGSVLAGLVAYALARLVGCKAGRLLASAEELADLQRFFDTWGVGGIVASRALPACPPWQAALPAGRVTRADDWRWGRLWRRGPSDEASAILLPQARWPAWTARTVKRPDLVNTLRSRGRRAILHGRRRRSHRLQHRQTDLSGCRTAPRQLPERASFSMRQGEIEPAKRPG